MTSSYFDEANRYLNGNLCYKLQNISPDIKDKVQEIRLRVNRPLCLSLPDKFYFVTTNGCVTNAIISDNMLIVSPRDIMETFNNMCNYSVYAKQNEIKNGLITLKGGHRAGICGTVVYDGNGITNIRDISSINIRIAREHNECSKILFEKIKTLDGGLLVCGAPCSGKTTLIRDLAKTLSMNFSKKVSVIDTRGEIAATYRGVSQKNIGNCDVLDSYSKKDGFNHSIRCMSPDYVVCDEIGTQEDIVSIENAINSGVSVIASVHCSNIKELHKKENILKLLKLGAFQYVVFLDNRHNPGNIVQIAKPSDVLS